ncbi:unnamed protein product [Ciceribacter selenitireducens ATCC BAA-1503]|uniref:Uncharacterized protein n=1 Tax=Ciceribacter selenitireducens ATCC BAA-1503 TaxID=1336235 RepID=A0A376AHV6_9HYPH|nr:unnamed protein product [Ciceribacter selenitireducens ATCC BAA-1503]
MATASRNISAAALSHACSNSLRISSNCHVRTIAPAKMMLF